MSAATGQEVSRTYRFLPWRYGSFLLVCFSMIPLSWIYGSQIGVMLGFDLAALFFIVTLKTLFSCDATAMRRQARKNDANRTLILVMTGIVMLVVLVVVASELRQRTAPSLAMIGLIIVTLALAWCFSNIVYTLHYAYLFYRAGSDEGIEGSSGGGDHGGLDFPERDEPDYWDIAYFAFTLGMTFQTSDVGITSPVIRRVALFHCLAAFVFNLGIVAFTINIIGGG
jgi:uncharacterized membrane protein